MQNVIITIVFLLLIIVVDKACERFMFSSFMRSAAGASLPAIFIWLFSIGLLVASCNSSENKARSPKTLAEFQNAQKIAIMKAEIEGLCTHIRDNMEKQEIQGKLNDINAGIRYTGAHVVPQAVDSSTAMMVNRYIDSMRNVLTSPIDLATILDMDDPNQIKLVPYFLNDDTKAQAAGVKNPHYVYKGWQKKN